MKKLITISIFFLIFIVAIFFFNTFESSVAKKIPKYVLLDSNFQKVKSTISFFDNNKRLVNKNTYSISGLEQLSYHKDKIHSLSTFQSKLIEIDINKKFESSDKTSKFQYPLFYWEDPHYSISIYNYDKKQDMNFFTYEFSNHHGSNSYSTLRRIGIPFANSVINDKLLTYTRDMDNPTNKQFYFSIIPINSKNKIISIPINKPLPTRIEPLSYKENYYIMTENFKSKKHTLIKINKKTYKMSFYKLSTKDCDSFIVNKKGILSLHFSVNSIKYNQFDLNGHPIKKKQFNGVSLIKSKFVKGQPYMIYQKNNKTFLGKINKNLKLVTIMQVHKDTNDFLVL